MPRPYPPEFRQRALDLVRSGRSVPEVAGLLGIAQSDLLRAFRTADFVLIHAADCRSTYSSWTCCGVRY
jgi:hypothetical protein